MSDKVILKSKVGANMYRTHIASQSKPLEVKFTEKNDFTCEVPTLVQYKDEFGKVHTVHENWAQHLLNSYPDALELVEIIEAPVVTQSSKTASKKGKKNEEGS